MTLSRQHLNIGITCDDKNLNGGIFFTETVM